MERDILGRINNPFVVRLYYAFRTQKYYYLALEYLPGGDLLTLVKSLGRLSSDASCVYAAEIVLALDYLHSSFVFFFLFLFFFLT